MSHHSHPIPQLIQALGRKATVEKELAVTWWQLWSHQRCCTGSWCSRRGQRQGVSGASPGRTCLWRRCYWSPRHWSARLAMGQKSNMVKQMHRESSHGLICSSPSGICANDAFRPCFSCVPPTAPSLIGNMESQSIFEAVSEHVHSI